MPVGILIHPKEVPMSILKILAILGAIIGIVAWISESRFKGQRSYKLIVALILASVALFVMAHFAALHKLPPADSQTIAQNSNANPSAPSPDEMQIGETQNGDQPSADDTLDDDGFAMGLPGEEDPSANADAQNPQIAPEADQEKSKKPADVAPQETPKIAAAPAPHPAIENDPKAPIAVAGNAIDDGKINEVIQFTAKKSKNNPNGSAIVSYKWDFGDGATQTGRDVKHAYAQIGIYEAVLTVTDKDGRTARDTRIIEVNRPESRIHFIRRNIKDATSPADELENITGTYAKQFTGSLINIEAKGYMLSSDNCDCTLQVSINGNDCTVTRQKVLSNGGEGNLSVKATCKAAPGEISWTVSRKASNQCNCTWKNIKIEGNEG